MNHIERLIQQHCPNGVPFHPLGEVFNIKNGYTPSKAKKEYWEGEDCTLPWFRMEDIRTNGRILSDSIQHITPKGVKGSLFPANSIIIATTATIGEHALITVESLANQRFTYLSLKDDYSEQSNIKYLYYYMFVVGDWCRNNTNVSGFASVDMGGFKKLPIPIPPLAVQEAIVEVLDKFTDLESRLEEQLNAELVARQQQYEYYRNQLLTFDDKVPMIPLGEVGTFVRGSGLQKKDFQESGVGCIHYGQIYTHYGTFADETISFVSPELAQKLKKASKGDIIISGVSENIEDICTPVAWLGDDDICVSGDTFVFKHQQNPKYIAYNLQTDRFQKFKEKYAIGAKVTRLQSGALAKYPIPVPSVEEQERIVAVLDRFDALVNSLSAGLPAEITARRQQYEYYRNQLLTFTPSN